jgi:hypothetical protein
LIIGPTPTLLPRKSLKKKVDKRSCSAVEVFDDMNGGAKTECAAKIAPCVTVLIYFSFYATFALQ